MCDGATGCASGSQACTGTRPAFMPKPKKASAKAIVAHSGVSVGRAHRIEGEIAAEAGEHAEAEQDGQRADVRHEQVQKAGAPVGVRSGAGR